MGRFGSGNPAVPATYESTQPFRVEKFWGTPLGLRLLPCAGGTWAGTPSPPTKSFDFRGFDSSKLSILKGGNSHVR